MLNNNKKLQLNWYRCEGIYDTAINNDFKITTVQLYIHVYF